MELPASIRVALPERAIAAVALVCGALASSAPARADDPTGPPPWCASELETLPDDVCFHAGPAPADGRSTLVIFLHGLLQAGTDWQYAQERGMVRAARRLGFSLLTPRGRLGASRHGGAGMVAWPTGGDARARFEDDVLAEWERARKLLETRRGAPFDEVFVVGFSNGAYYASSLALRGRLAVDGYAVFAGGTSYAPTAPAGRRAPIFVGISAKDETTVNDARSLSALLKKAGFPHKTESRKVGHLVADAHLDHALAYLRAEARAAPAKP